MRRLKVLLVGLSELATLRDALMLRAHSKLAVVSNYWDLCSMSLQTEDFQVMALHYARCMLDWSLRYKAQSCDDAAAAMRRWTFRISFRS